MVKTNGRFILAAEHDLRASAGLLFLARLRKRLYTVTIGSPHFFLVVGFDRKGATPQPSLTESEVVAMRLIVHGPTEETKQEETHEPA